ncbi:MAG: FtsW/RodA/SpoVE family cell cycle protein, partial [Anaerolineaceae bacterium]|nr:FtsW/RodA/SpoVE family cell cycle protein [Anaerolineaceae bacterium]
MRSFFSSRSSWNDRIQNRLLFFAAIFVLLYAVILTLSPAVRLHSWLVDYKWAHWAGFAIWAAGSFTLNQIIEKRFPDRDPFLYPVAALLSGWGLLTIWRLDSGFGLRQTIWFAVGFAILWGLGKFPNLLDWLKKYKYLILVTGLVITALTFIFGVYPGGNGPRLWLGAGGVYIQPSEPLKMLLVIYLAAYLSERLLLKFRLFQLLNPTLILMSIALGVLVVQRDVGTAIVFVIIYTLLIYLAVGKKRILLISALVILAAGVSGYFLLGNIQSRLQTWINPWIDPSGSSYQVIQSMISIGAGGTFGRGPGLGSPSLVPVAHSDFIFTAIAEETGLAGTMALIACWALLVVRGLRTAYRVKAPYLRMVASGITIYFAVQ